MEIIIKTSAKIFVVLGIHYSVYAILFKTGPEGGVVKGAGGGVVRRGGGGHRPVLVQTVALAKDRQLGSIHRLT